jgi:hypothetical protein
MPINSEEWVGKLVGKRKEGRKARKRVAKRRKNNHLKIVVVK